MFERLDGLARIKRLDLLFSDVKVGHSINVLVGLCLLAVCERFLLLQAK